MEKTLKGLKYSKNILAIIAPAFLLFGAIFYIVSSFINSNRLPALQIMTAFGVFVLLFMLINLAYLICKITYDFKQKTCYKYQDICKNRLINKCYNFLCKYQNWIEIGLSVITIVASVMLLLLFGSKNIKFYWKVDFRIVFVLGALLLYSVFTTLVSKDKKAFIMGCIFTIAQLGVWVYLLATSCIMMYGEIGAYTDWFAYHIVMIVFCILSFMPYRLIAAQGRYTDILSTTSVGLGAINFVFGTFMYFATNIAKKIINGTTQNIDVSAAMSVLSKVHAIVFIIFGISIALIIGNIVANLRRFIKTKDVLGIIDVAIGVVGIILCTIGIFTFTKFMLYFPTQYV